MNSAGQHLVSHGARNPGSRSSKGRKRLVGPHLGCCCSVMEGGRREGLYDLHRSLMPGAGALQTVLSIAIAGSCQERHGIPKSVYQRLN